MQIDYSPFWQTLKNKGISQYEFLKLDGMHNKLLDKLKHNKNMNILTIIQICAVLECEIQDIVKIKREV